MSAEATGGARQAARGGAPPDASDDVAPPETDDRPGCATRPTGAGQGSGAAAWPASHLLAHAGLVAWLTCLAVAWALYPGGSGADPDAPGFAPLSNYWCDLLRHVAWNGADNSLGARWGEAAFALLGVASLGLYLGAAGLLPRRAAWRVRAGGVLASLAVFAVAFVPYEEHREAHAVSSLLAGLGVTVATVETLLRSWRLPAVGHVARLAGLAFFVAALACLVAYVPLVLAGGGDSVALPILQKVATLALVVWLPSILAAARRTRR